MGYLAIRTFGKVAMLLAVLTLAGGLWQIYAPGSRSAEYASAARGDAWLAFLLIGLIALRVSATLKAQSREIDWLKQRLDQVQLGK